MMPLLKKIIVKILTLEARLVLARYKPRIIAITGSMGKTTTKDAIYTALSGSLHVRKSEKSFNSELGVPLVILGLENAWKNPLRWAENLARGLWLVVRKTSYPSWLVLEVGADRPGDIRAIAAWLKPNIVVITGVPDIPVHVEFFRSPEDLAREKRSLAEHMVSDGTLVLNGDDARMVSLCSEFKERTVMYGFNKDHHWYGSHLTVAYEKKKPAGIRFKVHYAGIALPLTVLGALGRPRAYAALAACAVAYIVGVDSPVAVAALASWAPPPGRMRIIPGANDSTIIDDTYNSSPVAALSALDTLKDLKATRRVAVLGDMLELGKYAAEAHRAVGARAASADALLTVGFRSRATAEAALDAGMSEGNIREYEQNESRRVGEELRKELQPDDVVLVKGSQSMRMERTVEELMQDREKASELLVRQEPEWLLR